MRGERWASSRIVALVAGAWFFLGVMVGCGDAPNPCDSCPTGTHRCQRTESKKGDPLWSQRWECLEVKKVIMHLSVGGPGSGEGPLSDTAGGVGGLEGTE